MIHNQKFVSLKAPDRRWDSSTRTVLKELGAHPKDGEPVRVLDGRYVPYVNHGCTNATIPKQTDPRSVSFEQAVKMLAEREKSGKGRSRGGRRRRR